MNFSPLINEQERTLLQQRDEAGTRFKVGQVVVFDHTGLLETLVTVQQTKHRSKDHDFFRYCILVQSQGSDRPSWILSCDVRPTTPRDLHLINGLRFSEWQRRVYYALMYRAHACYAAEDLTQLQTWWEAGYSYDYAVMHLILANKWQDDGSTNIMPHHRALFLNEPTLDQWAALGQPHSSDTLLPPHQKGLPHARQ